MIKQIIITAVTFLVFFIALFFYSKLAGPIPFTITSYTTTTTKTFDVTGEGKVTMQPDSDTISAGVTATGSTSQQVQFQINDTINKVSAAVKSLGIAPEDIKTTNYNINPTYNYNSGSQQITGYSGNTTLTITVKDITKVNRITDALTAAGATNVNNQGFSIINKTNAENIARQKAITDAQTKAQQIAHVAGLKLNQDLKM